MAFAKFVGNGDSRTCAYWCLCCMERMSNCFLIAGRCCCGSKFRARIAWVDRFGFIGTCPYSTVTFRCKQVVTCTKVEAATQGAFMTCFLRGTRNERVLPPSQQGQLFRKLYLMRRSIHLSVLNFKLYTGCCAVGCASQKLSQVPNPLP